MIIRKKYKLIIYILWLFCSVALSGCRDCQSEMLLAGQTETENTRTPEVTEAVDAEITKTAEVENRQSRLNLSQRLLRRRRRYLWMSVERSQIPAYMRWKTTAGSFR